MKIKFKYKEGLRECYIQSIGNTSFIISLNGTDNCWTCNNTTPEKVVEKLFDIYYKKKEKIKCYFTGTLEKITSLYTEDMEKLL